LHLEACYLQNIGAAIDIYKPMEPYVQNRLTPRGSIPPKTKKVGVNQMEKVLYNIKVFQSDLVEKLWILWFEAEVHENISLLYKYCPYGFERLGLPCGY
jgi:hypothetical protein